MIFLVSTRLMGAGLTLALAASVAVGQGTTNTVATTPAAPRPSLKGAAKVVAKVSTNATSGGQQNGKDNPGHKPIPGVAQPSKAVQGLIKDFQAARQSFLAGQQDLLRQLKQANEEQRSVLREQLKENLQNWLEEQKSRMKDLRDDAKEIKNRVAPLGDAIDSGKSEGRGR